MVSPPKKKVLLFIDWFTPGYKAGGPIQSCENLIAHLSDEMEFWVVTRNTDYGETIPYPDIPANSWLNYGSGSNKIHYISNDQLSTTRIKQIVSGTDFDYIYLNGVYSIYFTLVPLYYSIRKKDKKFKTIVAARGMLAPTAIAIKRRKKQTFLQIAKLFGLFDKVVFHATSEQEILDIKKVFGDETRVILASNLPKKTLSNKSDHTYIPEPQKELRLFYLARIAPEKNLKFALQVLNKVKSKVCFDIYGPVYNQQYWRECETIISKLPENIKVKYCGPIENSKVTALTKEYHFLFLPTLGENFGHSIFESLSNGVPVIISDKTPWQELEQGNAGWSIPLPDLEKYVETINNCGQLTNEEYQKLSQSCVSYIQKKINIENIVEENLCLFNIPVRILIFTEWYIPGFRGGGPIKSIYQIIEKLKNSFDFFLFTRNKDYNTSVPYTGINSDSWIESNGAHLFYSSSGLNFLYKVRRAIKKTRPEKIYINGLFSFYYSIIPLIYGNFFFNKVPVIISPRGMLSAEALSIFPTKKRAYLFFTRLFYKNVTWHVSTPVEAEEVKRNYGEKIKLFNAINIPFENKEPLMKRVKNIGELKLVFFARISQKKNLIFAINILSKLKENINIVFDIYGPIEDMDYWQQCRGQIKKVENKQVKINYKGELTFDKVFPVISHYHFSILPTLNENFGHSIIESLGAGTVVIVSDGTPWKNLEKWKLGWDISLKDKDAFVEKIETAAMMDQKEFDDWSQSSYDFARDFCKNPEVKEVNSKLFQ